MVKLKDSHKIAVNLLPNFVLVANSPKMLNPFLYWEISSLYSQLEITTLEVLCLVLSIYKYCLVLLLMLFIISGAHNLITNIMNGKCATNHIQLDYCIKYYATMITIINKTNTPDSLTVQLYLNFASVTVIILFLHYIRYKMRKMAIDIESKTITPSDYALKLTRVPVHFTSAEIKSWFEDFSTSKTQIKCRKVVRTYNINNIHQLETAKAKLYKKYQKLSG